MTTQLALNIELYLKDIAPQTKSQLIVTKEGNKYEENVWSFHADFLQKNVKKSGTQINWNVDLQNGSSLTDESYERLLITCKDFILSLKNGYNRNGNSSKPSTIIKAFKSLIPLLRWMVSEHIFDLSDLDSKSVNLYLNHLRTSTSRYSKPIGNGEIFKRLNVINELWKSKKYISNGIVINPFPTANPYELSGITKSEQTEKKFDFIPDTIAVSLGTIAANYVENLSKNILDAQAAVDIEFENTLLEKSESTADKAARVVANNYGYCYVKDLSSDIGNLRTACYIIVALFTGIRDSEISSLEINCMSHDLIDGFSWVNGYIYKTADTKNKVRWMAPPIVGKAVEVMEKLTLTLRGKVQEKIDKLIVDINSPLTNGVLLEGLQSELRQLEKDKNSIWLVQSSKLQNSISTNKTIHQQLIDFVEGHDIPFHNGAKWKLHPHQFRKTFVKFMVKNSMNLKYLQEHFKHISLDMTAWYDIDDITLSEEISAYYNELTSITIDSIVNSDNIAGKGGQKIASIKNNYFYGDVQESKEKVIKGLSQTVTLRSTGVSWCMGDIENGNCSGVHGCMIDPSNVNECSQAIITKEHLPSWQEIKFQNEQLLKLNEFGVHQKGAIENFLNNVVNPVINQLEG